MKLPGIRVGEVGRFHGERLPRPNYQSLGNAISGAIQSAAGLLRSQSDTALSEATGTAAQELSLLRAKLEASRAIPTREIPDEIPHEVNFTVTDSNGNVREVGKPFVYTHEVADEWWAIKSQEIVNAHASKIADKEQRAKFVEEMMTRYVAPGSQAIATSSIIKSRAHNQATAQDAVEQVLASDAPTADREEQARAIIERQVAQGADTVWAAQQLDAIGPRVDQIDVQNQLMKAQSQDQVNQIVEDMWTSGNRMTPETMRTVNAQADKMVNEFERQRSEKHKRNGAELTSQFFEATLTVQDVNAALERDDITRETAMILYNALQTGDGGAAKASNQFTLSKWRNEIIKLPYTGNKNTVSGKAEFLKLAIQMEAMGLTPTGVPTGRPPGISGTDAAKLVTEIDTKVKNTLEAKGYDDAWQMIKAHTGVQDTLTGLLVGDQPNVEAATAFKQALMQYMDQFGIDADPIAFFNENKASFKSENFEDPVNQEFVQYFPQAKNFMTTNADGSFTFTRDQQRNFVKWLSSQVENQAMNREQAEQIAARFAAYYRGQGQPPNGGRLMLEEDHPLYQQFGQ
jgi:hypothetical protein